MLKCFDHKEINILVNRIQKLSQESVAHWGKMNVSQMLKHCTIPYVQIFNDDAPKAPFLMRTMVRLFFKKSMTNETPYKENLPTAPNFIIANSPDIEETKAELINFIHKTYKLGADYFEGKNHSTLGKLSAVEWNNMLFKHLDHHLRQFGV